MSGNENSVKNECVIRCATTGVKPQYITKTVILKGKNYIRRVCSSGGMPPLAGIPILRGLPVIDRCALVNRGIKQRAPIGVRLLRTLTNIHTRVTCGEGSPHLAECALLVGLCSNWQSVPRH